MATSDFTQFQKKTYLGEVFRTDFCPHLYMHTPHVHVLTHTLHTSFLLFYIVSFTSRISIPFISLSLHIHPLPLQPPPQKIKFQRKKGKKEGKTQSHHGSLSVTVSRVANPVIQIYL